MEMLLIDGCAVFGFVFGVALVWMIHDFLRG